MQTLNLTNVEKSDIKYTLSRFPDGEVQITLGAFSRKDDITVQCRITNAEDLFILCQVNDILTRHGVDWDLEIYYLMGARMDRVMDFNRPFTLKVVSDILNSFSNERISVLEPHSVRTELMLNSSVMCNYMIPKELVVGTDECKEKYTLVLPDEGAHRRLYRFLKKHDIQAVICNKKRDVTTGKLLGFEVTNPEVVSSSDKPFIIIDDLCDGGGTFCGIASEIRKIRPDARLEISVTHMVNPRGIENLSNTFDHVYFTNSYKDWKDDEMDPFPENVTQIDVI